MNPDDVHGDEMPTLSDDLWPAGDPALASLAEDLRILAGGPAPEPRPGLVAVMRQGVVDPITTSPGRRKMLVKTLIGSLAAKIALGMGVATASVTAAGAAGVLPDPAQRAVASVVDAATPFVLPVPSDAADEVIEIPTIPTTTTTTLADGDDDDADEDASGRTANHGACVSAAARDKSGSGSHGKTVSSVARSDCGKTATTPSTTVVSSTTTSTPASTTSSTSVTASSGSEKERSANRGSGSANRGRGNSGNSGNGNGGENGNGGNSGRGSSGKG